MGNRALFVLGPSSSGLSSLVNALYPCRTPLAKQPQGWVGRVIKEGVGQMLLYLNRLIFVGCP